MSGSIEIFVGDVSDVEAHVFARYVVPAANDVQAAVSGPIELRGTLRGPYCTQAHTLPAAFKFRDLGPNEPGFAVTIVPDPCIWSSELPHLYQADVEVRQGDKTLALYHGLIGLKRSTPREPLNP
jgi:hypothetical protein